MWCKEFEKGVNRATSERSFNDACCRVSVAIALRTQQCKSTLLRCSIAVLLVRWRAQTPIQAPPLNLSSELTTKDIGKKIAVQTLHTNTSSLLHHHRPQQCDQTPCDENNRPMSTRISRSRASASVIAHIPNPRHSAAPFVSE